MDGFNVLTGKRIRELRESQGYTREKLAELAGMNDKFLYEVETGKKGLSAQKMSKLSISLGVTMDFIVFGEQKTEDDKAIISFLTAFNKAELKNAENIINKILAILKYCSTE